MDSSDRYLDLAGRVGDGSPIQWESEQGKTPAEDAHLLENLRLLARVGEVHRSIRSDEAGSSQETVPPAKVPEAIGSYRIHRLLGTGGLGVVYEAEQQNPRRPVALKVLRVPRASDPEAVRRFEHEARTLARLHHPFIAGIYESGCTETGAHFIAMELVRGATLQEWRAQRPTRPSISRLELRKRLGVFRKICDAVAYAHQRGVIHRDLKPSNILVQQERSTEAVPHVKILDFGVAHAAFSSGVTEPGRILGTLRYMSPEQTRGNPDEVDVRTDIYSLGVILYELLTDGRPYEVDTGNLREKAHVIRTAAARPLAESWGGSVEPEPALEAIVLKALRKDPAERYQSVFGLIDDIDRYLAGSSQGPVAWKRWFAITGILVLLAYAVIVTVLVLAGGEPR